MSQSRTAPSDEVVAQLQATLLSAILSGHPLPGSTHPVPFPDLAFVLSQANIVLVDENLAGPLSIEASPKPVQIVSRDGLLQQAATQGDIVFLRFQPPEVQDQTVRLTLEAKIALRDPNQSTLGLGGIQITFQKVADQWQVVGDSRAFAT